MRFRAAPPGGEFEPDDAAVVDAAGTGDPAAGFLERIPVDQRQNVLDGLALLTEALHEQPDHRPA